MDESSLQAGEGSLPCPAEFAEKLEARKQGRSASEREAAEQLAAGELAAVGSNLLLAALGNGGQHGGQNVGLGLAAGSASLLPAGKQPRLTGMSNASEGCANGSLSDAPKAQFHAPPTASILGAGPSVNTDSQLLAALKQMSGQLSDIGSDLQGLSKRVSCLEAAKPSPSQPSPEAAPLSRQPPPQTHHFCDIPSPSFAPKPNPTFQPSPYADSTSNYSLPKPAPR